MKLTPDALLLGPLALSWPNLALLVGILAFTWLAARQGQEGKAWWVLLATLLAARMGYAVAHLSTWPSLGAALLGIVDIRSGGWNWWVGLPVGALAAIWLLRQESPRLLVPGGAALALALLPLGVQFSLTRPVQTPTPPEYASRVLQYLEREFRATPEQREAWIRHWLALGFAAIEALLAENPSTGEFC
ncbi:MAG: TlpA family protein disulfide reductase, partial [Meiothermus sp.]|nr:TlpA family protein disulfide reductase [Meiothermus sp.]